MNTFTAHIATATAVGTTTAEAREPRPPTATSFGSPYAEPNPAIGGRTMAQYVADHVAHRITVH